MTVGAALTNRLSYAPFLTPHHYLLSLSVSSGKLGFDSWWALIVVVAVAVVAVAVDAAA